MKRFLSIILTAAMLMSATPAVFAENNAVDESVTVAEELTPENQEEITGEVTEEVTENVTEDVSEEISGEGEENSEEQISLMSGENNISLLGSESSEKMTGEVTKDNAAVRVDNIKGGFGIYYFDTLTNAVNAINSYPPLSSNTAEIQILKENIELADTLNVGNESTKVRVQIFANDNCTVKRADGFKGAFFNVSDGSTLTFGHTGTSHNGTLTLDGNKSVVTATAPLIVSGGTLIFNRNIILQNNLNQSDSPGAGVYIGKNGSFTMKDGCIENNSTSYLFGGIGGGVYAEGDVTITGGTIQKNTRITTCTGYEGETGNSIYFKSAKTLKITGGNLKCNFGNDDEDIILSSYSMTYKDEDNNETFEYTNCILELSGSPSFNTLKPEIDKRHVIMKKDGSEVTLTVKPEIKITSALNIDSPITILGGWYFDWTVDPEVTYADIPVETQLVTFADGVNASDYVSKFKYSGEETRYFDVDSEGGLSLTDTPAGYAITIINPSYAVGSLGTIKVSGADNLTAVPAETELTLSIADENVAIKANHSFVKWVVKTESGTEVTVTDNKFTMPGEAVTVTAEYVPDIQMTFYAGPSADTTYECKDYTWNDDGTITYTMPGNKGTLTISTPNGFKLWQYIVDDGTKTPTVTANDIVTVTVNTNEGYTFNGIKSVKSQMGKLTGTFNNSDSYTFSVPVGTHNDYRGTQNAYIILDITKNQYNITKNYNTNEGEVIVIDRFDSTHTSIDKAYYKEILWVSIEPEANYKIKSVSCTAGGIPVSDFAQASATGKSYTFTMPASDVTINVEFELDACAITTNAGENGDIRLLSDNPAAIGSTVNFTVTANAYYELDTLTVKDSANTDVEYQYNEASDSYSFIMPGSDVTISATFKKKQYSVTTNGSKVAFSGLDDKYTWGDTVEFTVTPEKWYNIKDVTVAGVDVKDNGNGSYSFIMPTNDVEIKATAERPNFNVEFVSNGGSSVNGQVIANGDTVAKPTTPTYVNHGFAGWYTSPTFEADTKYDFSTNVTGDLKLYARWFLWGDVNGDGNANSMDALLINRCRIGAINYSDLKYAIAARVNDVTNTTPNSMDALLINRHRIGAIAIYPVETQTAGYEFDLESNTFITNK